MNTSQTLKIQSIALLIAILFQTIYPTTAYAIADGPGQPEFLSYEDFNSTDMVNLITGDFSYNLPLLNIPSPEGGFQMSLSYHAGIELDEESSWVGLGWTMNPGSITRNVNAYPDDYSNATVNSRALNPGGSRSIRSAMGYTEFYENGKCTGGTVNLMGISDFGWGSHSHIGLGVFGLTLDKSGSISYNSEYQKQGLANAAMLIGSAYFPAASIATSLYSIYSSAKSTDRLGAMLGTTQVGAFKVTTTEEKFGLLKKGTEITTTYKIDNDIDYKQFGVLNLGRMPTTATSVNSNDIYFFNNSFNSADKSLTGHQSNSARIFGSGSNNALPVSDMVLDNGMNGTTSSAANLGYDFYSVRGSGVSGSINPYRLDIGSLSNSELGSGYEACVGAQYADYKVPFKYVGDYSNSYLFHKSQNTPLAQSDPLLDIDVSNSNTNLYVWNKTSKTHCNYSAAGGSFSAFNTNFSSANQMESNRSGLYNARMVHAKHIEWFTNAEIDGGTAKSQGFINTHQGFNRSAISSSVISLGIGGFAITNELGYTHHYSIPVYNKQETLKQWIDNSASSLPPTYLSVKDENPYATTWLLTGITGPDFVDRNDDGIIDNNDWGYWVKFEYGLFASDFTWRNPYFHSRNNIDNNYVYKYGKKQTYYLDRVVTRSHTAIFEKSLKNDGKSYYETDGKGMCQNDQESLTGPNVTVINEPINQLPSSSLKLDNIYVLKNEDLAALNLVTNGTSSNNELANGDTYANIIDKYDIAALGSAINSKQIQKISFSYDYHLCKSTLNSFEDATNPPAYDAKTFPSSTTSLKGKLSLLSVAVFGGSNIKMLPSYEFNYGDASADPGCNPDYEPTHWDGYGMFKSGAGLHNSEKRADQWCLKKILTPLGSELNIEYERDTYSSINGRSVEDFSPLRLEVQSIPTPGSSVITMDPDNAGNASLTDLISVGDQLIINFTNFTTNNSFSADITQINGNDITINAGVPSLAGHSTFIFPKRLSTAISAVEFGVKRKQKYGGGIRVKSITTRDENGNSYPTHYIYTKNGLGNVSSGVATYESEYDRLNTAFFDFYGLYDHPYSPILYSNVTVINGMPSGSPHNEFDKKQFHFVTPHENMLTRNSHATNTGGLSGASYTTVNTQDNTSSIGNLDTIKAYNQFGNLIHKTVFSYNNTASGLMPNADGGVYSESSLLMESNVVNPLHLRRLNILQSYKVKYPNFLRSVTTVGDRLIAKREMLKYDNLTGQVLKSKSTYGNSDVYENEITPAYTKYPGMGSKALDPDNRNLMVANAQTYYYVYNKLGQRKLLGSTVMTWGKDQYYRGYNSNTSGYDDQQLTSSTQLYKNTWLPKATYVWKSDVEENGVVSGTFADFNFNSTSNDQRWKKTSVINLYDHYSHVLETADINGEKSSLSYGYDNSLLVAGCRLAPYGTWCYSGAEDRNGTTPYFDGEVLGGNYQSTAYPHTGRYCVAIPKFQKGFRFVIDESKVPQGYFHGKYRASVWIHNSSRVGASLNCYAYNHNFPYASPYLVSKQYSSTTPAQPTGINGSIELAGQWYLYNIDVDLSLLPSNCDRLEFSVSNGDYNNHNYIAAPVYADDFRVHPLSTPIVSNVYNTKAGWLSASLNEDNYAVKYYYDETGKIKSTYRETKTGFLLNSENEYHYAKPQ